MTYLNQPLIAEGFLQYKRRQRLKYGAAFASCALGSILSFSIGAANLNGIDADGQYRTENERRAVMMRKLPSAIASFAFALPLCAFSLRLKRLSEDSHDLREEQRIAHRQWQNTLYQPPPPKELQSIQFPPPPPPPPPELNLNMLLNASMLLIYGGQGSAKTTFARGLGFIRQSMGHRVRVADPHGAAVRWAPWQVLGSGRKYGQVETALKNFDEEVTRRYELYSEGQEEFPRETVICDELTQWAEHVESAPAFIKSACSDVRKVMLHVILISHGDTIDTLGGAKGLRTAIDGNAIKLHLESTLNPADGTYMPTGYGTLYVPGQQPMYVKIPDMRAYIVNPTQLPIPVQHQVLPSDRANNAPALSNDLPSEVVDFLNWLAENRALAEEGYIRKSAIQQQFKPHRKGMKGDTFTVVLQKLHSLGYIEFVEDSPARVKLLNLP